MSYITLINGSIAPRTSKFPLNMEILKDYINSLLERFQVLNFLLRGNCLQIMVRKEKAERKTNITVPYL